jgi:hypothetical protein
MHHGEGACAFSPKCLTLPYALPLSPLFFPPLPFSLSLSLPPQARCNGFGGVMKAVKWGAQEPAPETYPTTFEQLKGEQGGRHRC